MDAAQTSAILLLTCSPCWSSCWCLILTTCQSKRLYLFKNIFCGSYCTAPFFPLLCFMIRCYVVLNLCMSQLMYFVLDMANFLQCKDDLLQSFCHAFTIPSSFSQQIRAFWMLDHGHVKVYSQEAKLISCTSGWFWSLFKWTYAGWLWSRVRIKGQLTIPLITLVSSFQQP